MTIQLIEEFILFKSQCHITDQYSLITNCYKRIPESDRDHWSILVTNGNEHNNGKEFSN